MDTNSSQHIDPTPAVKSSFSWHRMLEIANFSRPSCQLQLLIYLGISLLLGVLIFLPAGGSVQTALFTLCWAIIPYMVYFGPCMLTRYGDARIVERMMPVKASERYVFFLLYFLIAVPLAAFLIPELCIWIYSKMPEVITEEMRMLSDMHLHQPLMLRMINILGCMATILTCLYTVQYARHNRLIKSIAATFGTQIGLGILGAFYGLAEVFKAGYKDGMEGKPACLDGDQIVSNLMQDLFNGSPFGYTVVSILLIFTAVMLYLNYRVIARRNL